MLGERRRGGMEKNFDFFGISYKYGSRVDMCHLGPDSIHEEDIEIGWQEHRENGSWKRGSTAGGRADKSWISSFATNPQYRIELTDSEADAECLISLLQKGGRRRRAEGGSGNWFIGEHPLMTSTLRGVKNTLITSAQHQNREFLIQLILGVYSIHNERFY